MTDNRYPVTVAVTRPDGSVEHVRVGTAVKQGNGFSLQLGELAIGTPEPTRRAAPSPAAPPPPSIGGMTFPPYGRSKGAPIAGATLQDLEYYASGARRSLADAGKARWHDKERQLLSAIEAEIARQGGGGGSEPPPAAFSSPFDDGAPPRGDDDIPF